MNPSNGAYISSMTITAPETASAQSASATIVVAFHGANRPNPINVIVNQKTSKTRSGIETEVSACSYINQRICARFITSPMAAGLSVF